MKKIFILLLILIFNKNYSQTLTQTFNEPIVGDTDKTYFIDTSAFTTGLPINITGTNCVWNFSKISPSGSLIADAYVSPTAVSSSSNYTGCTMVLKQGPINNFYKSSTTPTTQTELLGFNTGTLALTFTNTAIMAKYPISYGSSIIDNIAGTFVFTVNGTCSGGLNTNADGIGTLQLANGQSLNNVLRIKSTQTLNLSAVVSTLIPIPIQIGTIKQTSYYYFHSSSKFPVLTITYQSLSFISSSTPTLSGVVSGNARVLVLGLSENHDSQSSINIYPNPFSSTFKIESFKNNAIESIKIFNSVGLLIYNNLNIQEIDLSDFAHGIYFIEIQTKEGILRKKVIKE